jgi:hypothetical protein
MTAIFKVAGSFEMPTRELFVVFGDVLEGTITPGMLVRMPLQGDFSVTSTIASVEFIDFVAHEQSFVAITFQLDDPQETAILRSVIEEGLLLTALPQSAA